MPKYIRLWLYLRFDGIMLVVEEMVCGFAFTLARYEIECKLGTRLYFLWAVRNVPTIAFVSLILIVNSLYWA